MRQFAEFVQDRTLKNETPTAATYEQYMSEFLKNPGKFKIVRAVSMHPVLPSVLTLWSIP